jgi:formylglycine-generating enzyme required for sulfatase activity
MGSSSRYANGNRDEQPMHRVEITRPFWLGVYPVTQEQYKKVTGKSPGRFSAGGPQADSVVGMDTRRFPAEGMAFAATLAFCKKLAALPKEKGREYRLPSEAMWEYACRAGGQPGLRFHFGHRMTSADGNIDGSGPHYGSKPSADLGRTCEVGLYPPNAWGLFDMLGNVFEWCSDWYSADYYSSGDVRDPEGPRTGTSRPLRGGAWAYNDFLCRAGYRNHSSPDNEMSEHGIRVALSWTGKEG